MLAAVVVAIVCFKMDWAMWNDHGIVLHTWCVVPGLNGGRPEPIGGGRGSAPFGPANAGCGSALRGGGGSAANGAGGGGGTPDTPTSLRGSDSVMPSAVADFTLACSLASQAN